MTLQTILPLSIILTFIDNTILVAAGDLRSTINDLFEGSTYHTFRDATDGRKVKLSTWNGGLSNAIFRGLRWDEDHYVADFDFENRTGGLYAVEVDVLRIKRITFA